MNHTFINEVLTLIDNTEYDENSKDNICLISHNTLEQNHIELECGHKFNYTFIYDEIKNQKKKNNKYEIQHLKSYQLKCPYCRNIQNKLLPFIDEMEILCPKVYGVNSPEKYCMMLNKCSYIFKSGKRRGEQCLTRCVHTQCNRHHNIVKSNRCNGIVASGKRKNNQCLKSALNGTEFCSFHKIKK
jgi:hypothetical protein